MEVCASIKAPARVAKSTTMHFLRTLDGNQELASTTQCLTQEKLSPRGRASFMLVWLLLAPFPALPNTSPCLSILQSGSHVLSVEGTEGTPCYRLLHSWSSGSLEDLLYRLVIISSNWELTQSYIAAMQEVFVETFISRNFGFCYIR